MGKIVKTTALKYNKEKEAAGEEKWKGSRNEKTYALLTGPIVYTSDSGSLSSLKAQASS